MIDIEIQSSALRRRLSRMSSNIQRLVKLQVLDSATQIELEAIQNAPTGIGSLIDKQIKNNGLTADIGVQTQNNIPIYLEFGTGTSAAQYVPTLPRDIQEYARTFYVNGQGTINKQPYLIPAYLKERRIFVKELRKIVRNNV